MNYCRPLLIFPLFWSTHLWAQVTEQESSKPTQYSVSQSIYYESNIFREPDGFESFGIEPSSGVIGVTRLRTDWRHQSGMQSYLLNAELEKWNYLSQSQLNHLSYKLGSRWNWSASPEWNGYVDFNLSQTQPARTELGPREKNLQDRQNLALQIRYSLSGSMQAIATAETFWRKNSLESLRQADYVQNSFETGIRYRPASSFETGFRLRTLTGEYGNNATNASEFTQNSLVVNAFYEMSGKSILRGSIEAKQRRHKQQPERNFSGTGLELTHIWSATGSITVQTSLGLATDASGELDSSYVKGRSINVAPTWAISEKTRIDLQASVTHRQFSGLNSVPVFALPITEPKETQNNITLGATHQLTPAIALGAQLGFDKRRSDSAFRDFTNRSIVLFSRLQF